LNAAGILLSKMLMLFIITVIIYSRHRLLLGKFRMYWTALYLLPLATAVVLVAQHYALFYFPDDHGLKILSAAGMILLIFSNLMIFAITDRMHSAIVTENRLVLAEELIKKQSEQYEQILNGSRDIIKIRHDHKNALMGLISDMEAEKYSDVKARLASDLTELEKPSFTDITGNIALDTVLGYKTAEAHSKGIEVVCRHNDVSDIPIPSVDISVLLGNALDNAIEAVQKLQDNRTVTVIIASRNGHIWITVTNSVAEDIDADNLTTQKAHSEYHGIGTVTMKAITEKYDGEIYFECRNRQFKTVIILPTQDE
ncbi:MAG: GHKL domain-containing protein, partial [Clostridia bacterium]|nr:GHKL domain-containing protein [Clostridia bacterium]